jgi:glycerophosphoryl diester phosphodiesterase
MSLFALVLLAAAVWFLKHLFVWSPQNTDAYYRRHPLVFAHRGLLVQAPENTLAAFRAALQAAVPALELDVVRTRDGQVVCSHNFDLERETDGAGFIDELDLGALEKIATGVRSHPDQPQELPLLEAVVREIPSQVRLNIEVKTRGALDIGTAVAVARMIKRGVIPQPTIVSSFNPLAIWAVKWVDPTILTGLILETMDYFAFINLVHPDCLHPTGELCTPDLLRFARERGLRVNVWTVNTSPAMEWLLEQGVDGIITDRPEYFRA